MMPPLCKGVFSKSKRKEFLPPLEKTSFQKGHGVKERQT